MRAQIILMKDLIESEDKIMSAYKLKTPKQAEAVIGAYKKIEKTVVKAYQKIEDTAVDGYKTIEKKFVDAFLEKMDDDSQGQDEKVLPSEKNGE